MPRRRALLIGCNYKGTPNELKGCFNDVDNIASMLRSVQYTDITVMKDDGSNAALRPTRQNILRQMQKFCNDTQQNDRCFVHYSGHGTQVRDVNGDEDDRLDEAICPADTCLIRDDEIRKTLIERLPPNATMVILLDCCHSGTGVDLMYNYNSSSLLRNQAATIPCEYNAADWIHGTRKRINERGGMVETRAIVTCISGCEDPETSADASFKGIPAGAMTQCFLEAWKECYQRELSAANLTALYQSLCCRLRCYRFGQRPQLSFGRRDSCALFERSAAFMLF